MLEGILRSELPSHVFREVMAKDPSVSNIRLGELLWEEFGDLSGEAIQAVWHWQGPGKSQGLSDENLDQILLNLFKEAGYIS